MKKCHAGSGRVPVRCPCPRPSLKPGRLQRLLIRNSFRLQCARGFGGPCRAQPQATSDQGKVHHGKSPAHWSCAPQLHGLSDGLPASCNMCLLPDAHRAARLLPASLAYIRGHFCCASSVFRSWAAPGKAPGTHDEIAEARARDLLARVRLAGSHGGRSLIAWLHHADESVWHNGHVVNAPAERSDSLFTRFPLTKRCPLQRPGAGGGAVSTA